MCRAEREPGGPRRCSKHMRERLQSATATFIECSNAYEEAREILRWRLRPSLVNTTRRLARSVSQVHDAEAIVARSLAAKQVAARALGRARVDYDSTRDGLQELRQRVEANPGDSQLMQRYETASLVYDREASRREVRLGPQGPLSRQGMAEAGPIGRRLAEIGAEGWVKGVARPESSGLWLHRVNISWREQGKRHSVTFMAPSEEEIKRVPGEPFLRGEPSMASLCADLEHQYRAAVAAESCAQWCAQIGTPVSPAARLRWRSILRTREGLKAILTKPELDSMA